MTWWKKFVNRSRRSLAAPAPAAREQQGGCDHSEVQLRQGTAEFEEFVALGELETAGNLEHGASHLCNLLSYDPGRPEWVDLLERYLEAASPEPEALIPRSDRLYYSTEAVRAYIWHKQQRLADAVSLLADVVEAKRDARYLEAWGLDWLEPPGAAESLSEELALRLFSLALGRFPEARMSSAPRLRHVQRWASGDCQTVRSAESRPCCARVCSARQGVSKKPSPSPAMPCSKTRIGTSPRLWA